jgi:hypothetical protein
VTEHNNWISLVGHPAAVLTSPRIICGEHWPGLSVVVWPWAVTCALT